MTTYRFRGSEQPTASSRASVLEPTIGDGVAELYLFDPIDSWGGPWGVSAAEFIEAMSAIPADTTEIRLHLNSPGGELWDGMAIINALRAHPARVVAIVDGLAASMASLIAVTADECVMGVGAQMMIHDAWNMAWGNEAALLKVAERLGRESDSAARMYAAKAGGDPADWRQLMRDETWYYDSEAVAAGLADRAEALPTPDAAPADAAAMILPDLYRYRSRAEAPTPRSIARTPRAAHHAPVSSEPGHTTRKENAVDYAEFLDNLRSQLGVQNAEADETQILAALNEALDERADSTQAIPEGTVLLERDRYDALQQQAADGAAARAQQITERRDGIISAAVEDGRISPANSKTWRERLDENEAGTTELIATLAPNRAVPLVEVGYTGDDTDDALYNKVAAATGGTKENQR